MSSIKDPIIGGKLLSSLRVVDLKEELEKRALSKSGTKKDLAERLRTYVIQHEVKAAAPPPPPVPVAPPPVLDEDELPSISMQEKQILEEKNPFLRDYFASQAELFHSQKVAKKLLEEEEARRESETSAPSADESSAADDKDLNSSTEEVSSGKVKQLARKFEKNSSKESPPKKEEPVLRATPAVEPEPVVQPLKSTRQRQLEKLAKTTTEVNKGAADEIKLSPSKPTEVIMTGKVIDQKPVEESKQEEVGSPASSRSSSRSRSASRSRSPSPESDHEQIKQTPRVIDAKAETPKAVTASQRDSVAQEDKMLTKSSNGNVRKLTERFENKASEDTNAIKAPSPTKKVDDSLSAEPEIEIPVKKIEHTKMDEDDLQESRLSSRSSSSSGSRSPSPDKEPTEQHEEKSPQPKEDEDSFQNGDSLPIHVDPKESATLEHSAKVMEPVKKHADNKVEAKQEKKAMFAVAAPRIDRTISAPEEEEEMLDYGEEDKIQTEPPKFDWTRRVIRIKNKHVSKAREHKWKIETGQKPIENINSELMSEWFKDVRLAPAIEFKTENKSPEAQEEYDTRFTRTFSLDSEGGTNIKMENITITRTVSLIPIQITTQNDDDADKDLSPARNPPSEVILVSNLTRPFTLPQLRELLQRTGNLEDLWVDKIKSKCIAKYEKEEEAFETRAALHGVKWPSSNPKALHVDYSTNELLYEYKAREAGDIKPLMAEKPVTAENLPVREWDMGKQRAKSRSPKRRRSRSTSRDRKRSRRSPSPNRRRHSRSPLNDRRSRGDAKDIEPLSKALDELFRKTVATPCIYWLPLTAAQISEKEEVRRKRMIERERRIAEISKTRPR